MTTADFKRHPISAAFPLMHEEDEARFEASVKRHGVRKPILMFQDMVLDGWHRYLMARKWNKDCPRVEFKGTYGDAVERVRTEHARRNLTKGEAALAEEKLEQLLASVSTNHTPRTDEQKATAAGVSVRTQRAASVVARQAIAPVVKAVEKGEIPLHSAETIARLPTPRAQREALKEAKTERATPTPRKKPEVVKPQVGASVEALRELEDRNVTLTEEVERLTDRLAVAAMEGTDEERALAATTIAELRKELADKEVTLRAVADSRDSYARENTELKAQCAMYRRQATEKKRA